jgi:hypothetical protein
MATISERTHCELRTRLAEVTARGVMLGRRTRRGVRGELTKDDDGALLPILVIAQSVIVSVFREEWPAADRHLRQAAGDRIEPILSSLWVPRSVIAPAPSPDPDGFRNNWFA